MNEKVNPEFVALEFNKYINSRDPEGLFSLMTEDHIFIDNVNDSVVGRYANKQNWIKFFDLFPDYLNIFETVTLRGTKVIMTGYSTCSDKRLSNLKSIWSAEIEGDKVREWRVRLDTKENRKLLGI